MLRYLNRFRVQLTQEQLFPSPEELESLRTMPKPLRASVYKRLTQLSYICNDPADRHAMLRARNQLMKDTWSETNRSDNEPDPKKAPPKPSDNLPDAVK